MKHKIATVLEKAPTFFKGLFCVYLAVTLFMVIFIDKNIQSVYTPNLLKTPNTVLVLFSIGLLFFLLSALCLWEWRRTKRLSKSRLTDRQFYLLIASHFVLVFGLQLFISYHIHFQTGWDVGHIIGTVKRIALNGESNFDAWYYGKYPNNILLVYTLVMLYKAGILLCGGHPNMLVLASLCLIVCVSVFLATLCLYQITKSRAATIIGMLLGIPLIALSPWIVIPYSDVFGMLFPVLTIFCYLFVKNRYICYGTMTFFSVFGYFYKPTVLIVWIALFILKALSWLRGMICGRVSYKRAVIMLLVVVLSASFGVGLKKAITAADDLRYNTDNQMTMTHFLMMGMNPDGGGVYYDPDVQFSLSYPIEERQQANLTEWKARLVRMGPRGIMGLLLRKNLANYNDGTFAWGREGGFYREVPETNSSVSSALRSFYYSNEVGTNFLVFATIEQVIWLLVLICAVFSILPGGKKESGENLIALALLGVSVFLLLFECRARYLFVFSPLFVILAGVGLHKMSLRLSEKFIR